MKKILSILAALTLSTTSTLSVVACESGENKYAKLKDLTDENVVEFFDEFGKEFSYQGDFIFLNDGEVVMDNNHEFIHTLDNLFLRIINDEMNKKLKMKETNYIANVFIDGSNEDEIKPLQKYEFTGSMKFMNLETGNIIKIQNIKFDFEQTNNIGVKDIFQKVLKDFLDYSFNYASDNDESLTWARFDAFPMVKPIMEGNLEECIEYMEYYMNPVTYKGSIYKEYSFKATVNSMKRYDTGYNKNQEFAKVEAEFQFTDPKVSKIINSNFVMCTSDLSK
ncbi:hypothetical protein SSABA_v1c03510 [Spiroplasma sabaudiense Ar-1343]|uniref:Lipoprotein n=1 Tax=Spiroplasma sabaudiense Ar-1343 TaxID=1276257 RepID=W6AA93_9MOLU|nr:lipoprotein [Spiroplasma sabaudiense]AHI53760.1 hypothetical protein SSABA_v1c03510 [Spiroplasma sabaudiense Ar-1343]